MYKKGFTLAEVLLTLGIIGVVAALTIPAVVAKVQNEQYVTGLKKAFNTLKNIQEKAVTDHGTIDTWELINTANGFDLYFKPYLDIVKDCGYATDQGCWGPSYKALNGKVVGSGDSDQGYKFVTSDGISFIYHGSGIFSADVNGTKGPNRFGRDVYAFQFKSTSGIVPYGSGGNSESIDESCSSDGIGEACAVKVLSEGKIDYGSGSADGNAGWPIFAPS